MSNIRVLILGATGMLGHKLVQVLSERFDVKATLRGRYSDIERFGIFPPDTIIPEVDAQNFQTVKAAIESFQPTIVINAIGVVKQLDAAKDVVRVLRTNSIFPQLVSELAVQHGFRFITISTDCVFSGAKGMYTEKDTPDATDLYGRSKQYGEVAGPNCLTLRTSIIGREIGKPHGLIDWFLSQSREVSGYSGAIFSGLPTVILAELIGTIIRDHPVLSGIYHVSSEPISKYDLLNLVKQRLGRDIEIKKNTSVLIDRSLDSSSFRQTTGFVPPTWPEMVDRIFSDLTPYDEWRSIS